MGAFEGVLEGENGLLFSLIDLPWRFPPEAIIPSLHTKNVRGEERLVLVTGCFAFRHQSVSVTSALLVKRDTICPLQ